LPQRAAPAKILPDLQGARTSRLGDAASSSVQKRLERLRLHAVGKHDLLNQRVRQKVVDCLGAIRHGGYSFRLCVGLSPHSNLTLRVRDGTDRYRHLIPIGNGFVKHHEQRKIEFGS
jgi:hypothetical protein